MNLMLRAAIYGVRIHSAIWILLLFAMLNGYSSDLREFGREAANDAFKFISPVIVLYGLFVVISYALYRKVKLGSYTAISVFVFGWVISLMWAISNIFPLSLMSVPSFALGILSFVGLSGFYHWYSDQKGETHSL